MKLAAVLGFFAIAFSAWQALASNENLPGFAEGSQRYNLCGDRKQRRDCYTSVTLSNYMDTIDYQTFRGEILLHLTYAEEDFINSDAAITVEMCVGQGPSFGLTGSIMCTTFNPQGKVPQYVIDYCKDGCVYPWINASAEAGLGGFLEEANWVNFHFRLDSVAGTAELKAVGRRPHIISAEFVPESSQICWQAENVPNGDYIILRDADGRVVNSGGPVSRCAANLTPGDYRIEATGPGQAGPGLPHPATVYYNVTVPAAVQHAACVNNTCTLVVGAGADTCSPLGSSCGGGTGGSGRNKCQNNACVFDPSDSGSDQCQTDTDCQGTYATCVNNTCALVSGSGVSTCGPIGSSCGAPSIDPYLRIEPSSGSMYVGESMSFRAMYDADGSGSGGWADVTSAAAWSVVSGPARVSGGQVSGDAAGSATIRAAYGGKSVTASLAISELPPPSCTFTATPSRLVIPPPRSTQLAWSCEYATSCTISPGVGAVSPSSGTVSVSPTATTRYRLDCAGQRANTSVEVEVAVRIFEFLGGKLKEIIPR